MSPDELARLEEERRFLLRSLADLDRELVAGDLDEADYAVVRDGYTARAAAVLRQIEAGRAALPAKRTVHWGRVAVWTAGVLVLAVLSGWLVARSSGQRLAGQTMTGGQAADEVTVLLSEARSLIATDPGGAIGRYQQVIALEPDHPEARTYTAWLLAISSASVGDESAALALEQATALFEAVVADVPGYADAHCLYAVTAARWYPEPDLDLAREQGAACLDSNPPAEMRSLVEGFVTSLG